MSEHYSPDMDDDDEEIRGVEIAPFACRCFATGSAKRGIGEERGVDGSERELHRGGLRTDAGDFVGQYRGDSDFWDLYSHGYIRSDSGWIELGARGRRSSSTYGSARDHGDGTGPVDDQRGRLHGDSGTRLGVHQRDGQRLVGARRG